MDLRLPEWIRTPRLVLREPRPADAACIFGAYAQDPDVARHLVWRPHAALGETQGFIAYCIEAWASGGSRPYVLAFHEDESIPVGMLEARILPFGIDIGYVLARKYWGRA